MTKYIVTWKDATVPTFATGKFYEIVEGLREARRVADTIRRNENNNELTISKYGQVMLSRFENDAIR